VWKVLTVAGLAFALWSGWWWLGAAGHQKAWELWLADRQAAGWIAERGDITVSGYPNRIDTTLTDLRLADPESGWAWSAPVFQILSLSYKPNHVIAVWPGAQKISGPAGTADVTAETLRGSLVFVPETNLTLDRMQLEIEAMSIDAPDWSAKLDSASFATRRAAPGSAPGFAHDVALNVKNLDLPRQFKGNLDPQNVLPDVFETARVDLTIAYDAPWDRFAIEGRKPQPTALSVKDLQLTWGKLQLQARGQIDVDAAGFAVGNLTIKARNWREILDVAVAAGWLGEDMSNQIKSGLQLLATLSGDPRSIDLPLTFANRTTSLGPIPLGPAPKLTTN